MDKIIEEQLKMIKLVRDKQPKMSVEEAIQVLLLMANWCAW